MLRKKTCTQIEKGPPLEARSGWSTSLSSNAWRIFRGGASKFSLRAQAIPENPYGCRASPTDRKRRRCMFVVVCSSTTGGKSQSHILFDYPILSKNPLQTTTNYYKGYTGCQSLGEIWMRGMGGSQGGIRSIPLISHTDLFSPYPTSNSHGGGGYLRGLSYSTAGHP